VLPGACGLLLAACVGEPARSIRQSAEALIPGAEVAPVMLNESSPFYYPAEAWEQRIQGNVVLRLHVDADGRPVRDSTRVARTSGVPALDSAALRGAPKLRFRPVRRDGVATAVSLLFPVHFRHPEGPPFPGDSTSGPRRLR
jgi:TonB family protein